MLFGGGGVGSGDEDLGGLFDCLVVEGLVGGGEDSNTNLPKQQRNRDIEVEYRVVHIRLLLTLFEGLFEQPIRGQPDGLVPFSYGQFRLHAGVALDDDHEVAVRAEFGLVLVVDL